MKDLEIIAAVRAITLARLAVRGISAELKQSYQPTPQGLPSTPVITMQKLGPDTRYGWPERREEWDEAAQQTRLTESQQMESTFQFNAVVKQDPASLTQLTASDVLKATATVLQSSPTLALLRAAGLGVLRIGGVRNGFSTNDQDQFQSDPSFDVTFTHRDTTTELIGAVVAEDLVIHSV